MSDRTKIEIGAAVVVLLFLAWFGWQWHVETVNLAKAQAVADTIEQRMAEREKQWKEDRRELADLVKAIPKQTPAQVIREQAQVITLPKPIILVGPETEQAKIGDAIIPEPSIKPLFEELAEGKLCQKDLAKCAADLKDVRQESIQWEQAAKGGSKARRFVSGAVKVGIGIGIGIGIHSLVK